MFESSIPCKLIPPSVFVENFQCFKLFWSRNESKASSASLAAWAWGSPAQLSPSSPSEVAFSEARQFLTVIHEFCLPERVGRLILPCSKWENKSVCAPYQFRTELQTEVFASSPGHTGGHSWNRLLCCFLIYSLCKPSVQEKTSPVLGINCFIASQSIKSHCAKWLPFLATSNLEIATDPFGARYFQF